MEMIVVKSSRKTVDFTLHVAIPQCAEKNSSRLDCYGPTLDTVVTQSPASADAYLEKSP